MRVAWGLLLMSFICAAATVAQTVSASIQGVVTDSNGGVIVSARVWLVTSVRAHLGRSKRTLPAATSYHCFPRESTRC